jgi:hypothetical protein
MGEHKPFREDPEALTGLLCKVFDPVPSRLRIGAVREFADRLADIHVRHGRGEPEWLARLRARLALSGQADTRADAELLRAYLVPDNDGLAFNSIYCRYRDEVRACLEDEGLKSGEAEQRIGAVFIRALDRTPESGPDSLREMLLGIAREVAHDPDWERF